MLLMLIVYSHINSSSITSTVVSARKTYLVKERINNQIRVGDIADTNPYSHTMPDYSGKWCNVAPDDNDYFCVYNQESVVLKNKFTEALTAKHWLLT